MKLSKSKYYGDLDKRYNLIYIGSGGETDFYIHGSYTQNVYKVRSKDRIPWFAFNVNFYEDDYSFLVAEKVRKLLSLK